MTARPYFILSTARSGSTALARLLALGRGGVCESEPQPNLDREGRWRMDGLLSDAECRALVRERIVPRVRAGLASGGVYGEKNVTYGPFVRELHRQLDCRFVHLVRDGRDVVRSLLDWHTGKFGNIYREANDSQPISAEATSAAANLLVCDDASDFARPRPRPGDPLAERWCSLPRDRMCMWYWATLNALYLDELESIPADDVRRISLDDGSAAIAEHFRFLGLEAPDAEIIESTLAGRINSLADRKSSSPAPFPRWPDWDSGRRDDFERLAGETSRRLGLMHAGPTRWRPETFGSYWREKTDIAEWYAWMYESRRPMHAQLLEFIRERPSLRSIADVGCGIGVGYADALADRRYVGIDLAPGNVEWCRRHRLNPAHRYEAIDIVEEAPRERFDLVFSQGTIDNCYDVDEWLRAMVRWSREIIYVTCYRGWFPERTEHSYRWDPAHGCFYNDISPSRAQRTLEEMGCEEILIEPVSAPGLPCRETRIVARVPKSDR